MSLYTEKSSRIWLENRIKNMKGRSTSSEVDPSILRRGLLKSDPVGEPDQEYQLW